jgi:threonine efflux protein
MNVWGSEIAVVVAIIVLAVISPGPDFAIIVRNGLLYGRKNGLFTALGIASGISVHISYTLLGLGYAVAKSAWLPSI